MSIRHIWVKNILEHQVDSNGNRTLATYHNVNNIGKILTYERTNPDILNLVYLIKKQPVLLKLTTRYICRRFAIYIIGVHS